MTNNCPSLSQECTADCLQMTFLSQPNSTGVYTFFFLPDKEGRYVGRYQGLLMTESQGLPSRHTTETSSPGTEHTSVKTLKQKAV